MKNSNNPLGMATVTFRLVAQCFIQLRHRAPPAYTVILFKSDTLHILKWFRRAGLIVVGKLSVTTTDL